MTHQAHELNEAQHTNDPKGLETREVLIRITSNEWQHVKGRRCDGEHIKREPSEQVVTGDGAVARHPNELAAATLAQFAHTRCPWVCACVCRLRKAYGVLCCDRL